MITSPRYSSRRSCLTRAFNASFGAPAICPGILIVPVGFNWNTMARPPTRTALVIDISLIVWSSLIGGNIPRKSSDFAKSKGGVGLSEPSSEYNPILALLSTKINRMIAYLGRPEDHLFEAKTRGNRYGTGRR